MNLNTSYDLTTCILLQFYLSNQKLTNACRLHVSTGRVLISSITTRVTVMMDTQVIIVRQVRL